MIDDSNKNNDAFTRQRRNLLVVSLFLLFYEVTGLSFNEITLLGTKVAISNNGGVTFFLWGSLLYFLLRFYQVHPGNLYMAEVHATRTKMARAVAEDVLTRSLKESIGADNIHYTDLEIDLIGSVEPEWTFYAKGGVSWSTGSGTTSSRMLNSERFIVTRGDVRFMRIKSLTHVALSTPSFTEYVLPFCISILPIFGWLYISML